VIENEIVYISACNQYPLHELEVTDWLAKENGLDTISTGEISIYNEIPDAYQIEVDLNYGLYTYIWLPKSHCKIVERTGPKLTEDNYKNARS
jgi:hypothetical protein